MRKKFLIPLLFVFLILSALVTVPVSERFFAEKCIYEWVEGKQGQGYTLIIDGRIKMNRISKQALFEGDLYIKKIHHPK